MYHLNVPANIHPSRIEEDEDIFHSAYGTPISRSHSIRSSFQQFAGSYSRSSIQYIADSISRPESILEDELHKIESIDSVPYRTFSHSTDHGVLVSTLSRHHSTVSTMISQQLPADKSSFLQSVFNAVNVLVGVGILALPLAFRIAGWVYGSLIFLFCSLGTRYSAKIIIKCIQNRPNAVYSDMGETAFGNQGRNVISTIFVIELITIGVAMIVLLGDGLQSLFPHLTLEWTRLISALILSPTLFLSVRKLAYTSLIGIIGCICLVIIVLCDGFSKTTHPGSLIDHMPTEWYPSDIRNLPLAFGLIMSGFAGHAIFPSIYRDMENPKKYNRVVDLTYGITITCYIIMGVSGYLMFGQDTMQEITQNLAMMVEYNKALNDFAIWLLVLTPIAKFGLMMHPLNKSWELCLFGQPSVETWMKSHNESYWKQRTLTILGKLLVTCSLVYVAYLFPGFDKVMSLLGALFSFTISLIFPLICHIQLFKHTLTKKELVFNWFLLILSMGMAMFGTVWSFKPSEV